MYRRITAILLCACCLLSLTACGAKTAPTPEPQSTEAPIKPTETPAGETQPTPSAAPTATPAPETPTPTPVTGGKTEPSAPPSAPPASAVPMTDEEILGRYEEAITAFESTVTLNVAGREWKYGAENDLKNLYYSVLSQHQELKYAYDMTAKVTDGKAVCTFLYMPYKTGAYADSLPAGSHAVGSLHDIDAMAQSMIDGTMSMSIAITDPTLEVEALQRALGQAGYGWIVFSLSRDGTEILASPATGLTMQDCVDGINESFRLAGDILSEIITDGMTDREKAEAAYSYITSNVAYDFRYYSGKNDLPFVSTVALGALRDNLAICGGYSHALETLLDMCGIENYTVSGVSQGEYHAWNYVVLDGAGYYCDPTADRGGMSRHLLLTADELTALGGYKWDAAFYPMLTR